MTMQTVPLMHTSVGFDFGSPNAPNGHTYDQSYSSYNRVLVCINAVLNR